MLKVVSVEEMRALERAVEALGLPSAALMENAGRAVADAIVAKERPAGRRALVLVGPGNNGGDGLVAARHLHDAGVTVALYLIGRPVSDDAKIRLLRERDIPFYVAADDPDLARLDVLLGGSDLVVDAVLGTGRARPIAEPLASVLERVNRRNRRQIVVALDLPTGVNADSGTVDPNTVRASWTITLGFPKRGLLMGEAVERVGELVVADIGIPTGLAADLPIRYATAGDVAALLPERPRASNKGTFGRVLIVAGSQLYTGAPVLAALGAERIGAGLVTLACPASVRPSLAAHTLETTFLPVPDDGTGAFAPRSLDALTSALADYRAVLVGPGIGRAPETRAFLAQLLPRLKAAGRSVVFDADALTLLAELPRFWEQLPAGSVLTPHPGEMARLVGGAPLDDRIEGARMYARQWGSILVLKGAYSVVASPDGIATVLPFANPTLATAGTGDVLAGAILGLLGQGLSSEDAAVLGGFVHGAAGAIVRDATGPAGALAGEVAGELPRALNVVREAGPRALSNQPSTW